MPKKLIVTLAAVVVLALGAVGYFLWWHTPMPTNAIDGKNAAWDTFERYLTALRTYNIDELRQLVYKPSAACADKDHESECFALMDHAYGIGSKFNKDDFAIVAIDDKQIILATPWHVEETDIALAYARTAIYFTQSRTGPRVLYFTQPEEIVYTFKDPAQTKDQQLAHLKDRIKDTDGDFLADEVETCSYEGVAPECKPTDPNKKDTSGDGWWDGVRPYVKAVDASNAAAN